MNHFTLIEDAYTDTPSMDVAVSHSILSAVSSGELGGVLRVHVPGSVVAFGRADRSAPGYQGAVRAAEAHGFAAVERLAGGRAAVFHERTLAFSWAVADAQPRERTMSRFQVVAELVVEALTELGLDACVGQIPGEYCPGDYSVSVAGKFKVMGIGQRIVKRAAHVGGVIVVDDAPRIRDVLIPVYRSLGLDWDPRTAGAVADRAPGVDTQAVRDAFVDAFSTRFELEEGRLPSTVTARARALAPDHLPRVA